jgi:hypothetical protein
VRAGLGCVGGIRLGQRVGALRPVLEAVAAGPVDIVVVVERTGRVQQRTADLLIVVTAVVRVLRLLVWRREECNGQPYRSMWIAIGVVSPGSSLVGHGVQRSQATGCGTG